MLDTWEDVWGNVETHLLAADSIAFDGCHKIYVLMDAGQTEQMVEYGYTALIRNTEQSRDEMLGTLRTWFNESCCLRFINAVSSPGHNEDFEDLIPQGFGEDFEDGDDDGDDW